jgi:NTE family protein
MSERPAVEKGTETPVQRHEIVHELDGVLTTGETLENRLRPGRQIPEARRNQIVTLAFLGSIPRIAELLAETLCAETDGPVVLVRFGTSGQGKEGHSLNGEFHFPPHGIAKVERGFHALTVGVSQEEPPSTAGIVSLIAKLSRHFRHVLIEAEFEETSWQWLRELLVRSDLTYLFFQPGHDGTSDLKRETEAARSAGADLARLKPIGCLSPGRAIGNFDELAERVANPIHAFIRDCPEMDGATSTASAALKRDVRFLAREVSGNLVGLALSSGAAKGFAHIGVLQVLEENGVEVDVAAGSSMGAYVGSLWAQGNDGQTLEKLARELEGRWPVWSLVDPVFPPRRGFVGGVAIKRRLMRTLGTARFAELQRPFRVVAANLETLERKVFSSGEVASAVHASIAVPGICVPVMIDGEAYVDGGIVTPLPVDVLREMGVTRVIAVDVIPTPERIRQGLEAERAVAARAQRRGIFRRKNPINQHLNYFAEGNLFEVLMRSIQGAQIRIAAAAAREADVVLRPEIRDDRWLDFRTPGKFIKLGREATETHLEEIKQLTARGVRASNRNHTMKGNGA